MRGLLVAGIAVAILAGAGLFIGLWKEPAAASSPRNTLHAGMVIDAPGTRHHADNRGSCDIEVSASGRSIQLAIHIREKPYGAEPGARRTRIHNFEVNPAGDPWFVYAESPSRFWTYSGNGNLHYVFTDSGEFKNGRVTLNGELTADSPQPPAAVIRRLPAQLQKVYSPMEPQAPRPSI